MGLFKKTSVHHNSINNNSAYTNSISIKSILACTIFILSSQTTQAVNLITNSEFTTDTSTWSLSFGDEAISWQNDADPSQEGTLQVGDGGANNSNNTSTVEVRTCVSPVKQSTATEMGLTFRISSGTMSGSCVIAAAESSTATCDGITFFNTGTSGSSGNANWTTTTGNFVTSAGTKSLMIRMFCANSPNDPTVFSVRFDDPFVEQNTLPVELQSLSIE